MPYGLLSSVVHDRRRAELLERAHTERHDAERERQRAALVEGVGAEAAEPGDAEREVDLRVALRAPPPGARRAATCTIRSMSSCVEHLDVLERHERAVAARRRRAADREVEVGGAGVDRRLEQRHEDRVWD